MQIKTIATSNFLFSSLLWALPLVSPFDTSTDLQCPSILESSRDHYVCALQKIETFSNPLPWKQPDFKNSLDQAEHLPLSQIERYYWRGRIQLAQNRRQANPEPLRQAIIQFSFAERLEPKNGEIAYWLMLTHLEKGNFSRANDIQQQHQDQNHWRWQKIRNEGLIKILEPHSDGIHPYLFYQINNGLGAGVAFSYSGLSGTVAAMTKKSFLGSLEWDPFRISGSYQFQNYSPFLIRTGDLHFQFLPQFEILTDLYWGIGYHLDFFSLSERPGFLATAIAKDQNFYSGIYSTLQHRQLLTPYHPRWGHLSEVGVFNPIKNWGSDASFTKAWARHLQAIPTFQRQTLVFGGSYQWSNSTTPYLELPYSTQIPGVIYGRYRHPKLFSTFLEYRAELISSWSIAPFYSVLYTDRWLQGGGAALLVNAFDWRRSISRFEFGWFEGEFQFQAGIMTVW